METTQGEVEAGQVVQTETMPARQWESFPQPRGWSMDWDERGLVPGRAEGSIQNGRISE